MNEVVEVGGHVFNINVPRPKNIKNTKHKIHDMKDAPYHLSESKDATPTPTALILP
jgi:hypothetical protein